MESQKPTQRDSLDDSSELNPDQGSQLVFPGITDSERTANWSALQELIHQDSWSLSFVSARSLNTLFHRLTERNSLMHIWANLETEQMESITRSREEDFVSRLGLVEENQRRVEFLLESAIQPMLAQRARQIELVDEERDPIPPAASAKYEWQSQVNKAVAIIERLTEDFDDLNDRLAHHAALIQQVQALLKLARSNGNRYFRSAVLTVNDALRSVYSEDLTEGQVNVIKDALSDLLDTNWDRDRVRALDRILKENGFETVLSDRFVRTHA